MDEEIDYSIQLDYDMNNYEPDNSFTRHNYNNIELQLFKRFNKPSLEELKQLDTINKGIDELIEKYQDKLQSLTWIKTISLEANEHNQNSNIKKEFYENIIEDLKKLKGE